MSGYYLTTPIYYANALPHIGHAYTTLAADAIARYHRAHGRDVFLLTGTDEHGINIERLATSRGITPQEHVEGIAHAFDALWKQLDIRYDRFIRTTEAAHRRAVLDLWSRLEASGDLYRGLYEGAYCPRCEAYYQADELDSGTCPVHGLACDEVAEENWFFRLSKYQAALEHIVRDTDFVQPESRRNEVLGQLAQGLADFSVSRRQVRWGIGVPGRPDEVIYVWVDALANYLTGVGFPDQTATFVRYWPAALHLVGKEIIRFHCIYWPALLLSAGLPLPKRVFAHGWLTRDGKKISKTTGNGIDPAGLAAEFGSDAVRYYFLRAFPFGQDGDYTEQAFLARYNADLANGFGNLVQRVLALAARHAQAQAVGRADHRHATSDTGAASPHLRLAVSGASAVAGAEAAGDRATSGGTCWTEDGFFTESSADQELCSAAIALEGRVAGAFETLALHEAAAAIGAFVGTTNRYLELTAPWTLAKQGELRRLKVVVDNAVHAARLAARHYAPFIPRAAAEGERRLTAVPFEVGPPLFPRAGIPVDQPWR
jgi:methionyl-tRNA synthetase